MSQLPNEQLARLLLDKVAEAITEIEVEQLHTLATAGQLITAEDTIWPQTRVAAWQFIEKVWEGRRRA